MIVVEEVDTDNNSNIIISSMYTTCTILLVFFLNSNLVIHSTNVVLGLLHIGNTGSNNIMVNGPCFYV